MPPAKSPPPRHPPAPEPPMVGEGDKGFRIYLRLKAESEARRAAVLAAARERDQIARRALTPYAAFLPVYVDPSPPTDVVSPLAEEAYLARDPQEAS